MKEFYILTCPLFLADASHDYISSGVAEFIMQEEFDRYTGYWWQALSQEEKLQNPKLCRLLYLEVLTSLCYSICNPLHVSYNPAICAVQVDESEVPTYSMPEAADISGKVDTFRYPKAGN